MHVKNKLRLTALTATLVAASLPLAACGDNEPGTAAPSAAAVRSPNAKTSPAASLTMIDPWVKAAGTGMSAAFGTLVNNTGTEITVVSGASPVSPKVELHEVVGTGSEMKMQPVKGGFVVAANGELALKPGGAHIMLMGLKTPIRPGDQVAFTLTLKDGTTIEFTALGKAFKGGNESYKRGR